MSNLLGAAFLGLLQGLTEFLPVSSSGHLVLFQQFVAIGEDHVLFDLVLHLGTLLPVLWFYRSDLRGIASDALAGEGPFLARPGVKLTALLVAASVPTAIIGLTLEDTFERLFSRPSVLTLTFAITGVLLFVSRRFRGGTVDGASMTWQQAVILGITQGLAITPGISRSGSTIAVALMLGLQREHAARFSFLMSVPAIGGAVLLKGLKADWTGVDPLQLLVGGSVALVSGYGALVLLVRLVEKGGFSNFAYYAWFAAAVAGVLTVMGISA